MSPILPIVRELLESFDPDATLREVPYVPWTTTDLPERGAFTLWVAWRTYEGLYLRTILENERRAHEVAVMNSSDRADFDRDMTDAIAPDLLARTCPPKGIVPGATQALDLVQSRLIQEDDRALRRTAELTIRCSVLHHSIERALPKARIYMDGAPSLEGCAYLVFRNGTLVRVFPNDDYYNEQGVHYEDRVLLHDVTSDQLHAASTVSTAIIKIRQLTGG